MNTQLEQWLAGNPVHNKEANQCCPDFSCCRDGDIAPLDQRERFVKAVRAGDESTLVEMLGMFLGHAMGDKVYVAGLNVEGGEQ